MRSALTAILAATLLAANAGAAPYTVKHVCLPSPVPMNEVGGVTYVGSTIQVEVNEVGVCAAWICARVGTDGSDRHYEYCGTWSEFAKSSSRLRTIRNAKDPYKSADEFGKRNTLVPLAHPSMQGMPFILYKPAPASAPQ